MGAIGTDVAIESADVVLMKDDWRAVPQAIRISRSTFRTIWANLVIATAFNVVGVGLAAVGVIKPALAAAVHVLPDVFVFFNSALLLRRAGRR